MLDHRDRDGVDGFLTITGGKLTTLRLMAQDIVDKMCGQLDADRPCRTAEVVLPGSEDGELYRLGERLAAKERHLLDDQLVCECEMIPRGRLEDTMRRRDTTNLDDIRRSLRLGMGPCQGGFCIFRATGILHDVEELDGPQANHSLTELPAGALEGRVADPLRRSAPPGAAGRLDLPGAPRRGASPFVTSPGWAAPTYDALVIGTGLAGLTAATRLAEDGARVALIAKGMGGTHLAPGTIDVLGYAPDRVQHPGDALSGVGAAHPYARIGAEAVARSIDWFKRQFDGGPLGAYGYRGDLAENALLPTTVGAPKPTAVFPETMAAGDLRDDAPMLIVGFRVLRDFHASYLADNLSRGGVPARSIVLDRRVDGRPEANSMGIARAFEDPAQRAEIVAEVAGALDGAARVGFPAALGMEDPHGVWSEVQERLGRPVFEIPTLPPSVSGMRVHRTLRDRLRSRGGRIVINAEAVGAQRSGTRVESVRATAAGREIDYRARWIVLATGGVATGGIVLDSAWQTRETALGLPVHGAPGAGEPRFGPRYFGEHPYSGVGIAVDEGLRPVGEDGARVCDNVLVAGATLAGAQPWKEKSGDGISLASGFRAAELILEEDR